MNKISLREILKHSAQINYVFLTPTLKIAIQPWVASQLDELQPLITRLTKQFKKILSTYQQKKAEDLNNLDLLLMVLEKNTEGFKEYINDIIHIIYVTIERSNAIIVICEGEIKKEFPIFSEEEMKSELPIQKLWEIARIIYKQNFEKNLYSESKSTVTLEKKPEKQEKQEVAKV